MPMPMTQEDFLVKVEKQNDWVDEGDEEEDDGWKIGQDQLKCREMSFGHEPTLIAQHVPSFESLLMLSEAKIAKQSLKKVQYTAGSFIRSLSFTFGNRY